MALKGGSSVVPTAASGESLAQPRAGSREGSRQLDTQPSARPGARCGPGWSGRHPQVSWVGSTVLGSPGAAMPAGTTTHQAQTPDYVPLPRLPSQSRAKGKGQRSRFRVQAAEKPKQSRA